MTLLKRSFVWSPNLVRILAAQRPVLPLFQDCASSVTESQSNCSDSVIRLMSLSYIGCMHQYPTKTFTLYHCIIVSLYPKVEIPNDPRPEIFLKLASGAAALGAMKAGPEK